MKCIHISWFFIFNFQKSRMSFCYGVTYFVSIFFKFLYVSFWRYVLAPTFIFATLILSIVKKIEWFQPFLEFRHFFGLQLIWFSIRQYWEFVRKPFPNFHLLLLIAVFSGFGIVFKRFFALESFSVAYVFSMINYILN